MDDDAMAHSTRDEERDAALGRIVADKYRIVSFLGEGASALVYRATHLQLNDDVALKLLHHRRMHEPKLVHRFEREAQIAAQLDQPNCVRLLDSGRDHNGQAFVVMELAAGRPLSAVVRDEAPLGLLRCVDLMSQVLAALDEAHARGIVHGDLKSSNIIVEQRPDGSEWLRVLDFGTVDPEAQVVDAGVGTPEYMSPEQARGEGLDQRTDIYAAGVILYEMACGLRPFAGENPLAVLTQQINNAPVPPALRRPDADIDFALDALIMRCLSKNRAERPESARELANLLSQSLPQQSMDVDGRVKRERAPRAAAFGSTEPELPKRPLSTWLMLAGLLLVGLAAGWLLLGTSPLPAPTAPVATTVKATTPDIEVQQDLTVPSVESSDGPEADASASPEVSEREPVTPDQRPRHKSPDVGKPSTDKPSTDKPSTDKPSTDKPSTDKPSTDKPSTDKPSTDAPATKPQPAANQALQSELDALVEEAQRELAAGNAKVALQRVEGVLARDPNHRGAQKLKAKLERVVR